MAHKVPTHCKARIEVNLSSLALTSAQFNLPTTHAHHQLTFTNGQVDYLIICDYALTTFCGEGQVNSYTIMIAILDSGGPRLGSNDRASRQILSDGQESVCGASLEIENHVTEGRLSIAHPAI
jgi:hypothetical protein